MTDKCVIQEINLRSASAQEYQALNRISNIHRAEILPDDPPFPLEETVRSSQSVPGFVDNFTWAAWDSAHAEIIATGNVNIAKTEDNQHLAEIGIYVRQPYRRQGIGTRLLEKIAQGKLNKFFKESTLMNQEFIKDGKLSIRQYLESQDKGLKATGFVRYTLNV